MFLSCIRPYSLNLPSMPSCVSQTNNNPWLSREERGKMRASSNTSLLIRSEQVADLLHQSLLHQNTHKVVFPEKLVQCELRRREDIIEFVLDSPLKKLYLCLSNHSFYTGCELKKVSRAENEKWKKISLKLKMKRREFNAFFSSP